jgi:hypothetical protein
VQIAFLYYGYIKNSQPGKNLSDHDKFMVNYESISVTIMIILIGTAIGIGSVAVPLGYVLGRMEKNKKSLTVDDKEKLMSYLDDLQVFIKNWMAQPDTPAAQSLKKISNNIQRIELSIQEGMSFIEARKKLKKEFKVPLKAYYFDTKQGAMTLFPKVATFKNVDQSDIEAGHRQGHHKKVWY